MFSDINRHWARACIVALAQRQLINGYPQGQFRPQATVSRAEFAAILQRAFPEVPIKKAPPVFSDVRQSYWASDAIAWASERNLFSGYPNGTFKPRLAVSRAQSVVVLVAAIDSSRGVDATATIDPMSGVSSLEQDFADTADIPDYARDAIASALNQNLLEKSGNPRQLHPQQALTRGELAALMCRALSISVPSLQSEPNDGEVKLSAFDINSQFKSFLKQEEGFSEAKLAFLDRGAHTSLSKSDRSKYAVRLQIPSGVEPLNKQSAPYPSRGDVFFVSEGGLNFLPTEVLSACVCIQSMKDRQVQGRWLGKDALSDRQLWSSTKFIPLLNVASQVNSIDPYIDISRCWIRPVGSGGRFSGFPFEDLATAIMTYDERISTSNALAVMFKRFTTPEALEKWTKQLTGNQSLSFQGRYGEVPFIQNPELWSSQRGEVILKSPGVRHSGQNLMSTYDLTRLITMLGWHWRLANEKRVPDVQTASLSSIIRAMSQDTARYVDVALETLGLAPWVKDLVVLSKGGFGRSDRRDRTELTYCALAQFSLPRSILGSAIAPDPTAAYQHYSFGFTLIAAQNVGDADAEARYVDAVMAAAVTALVARIVSGEI